MSKTNIFRKTSLDRIRSPEQLNEYIRVNKPSIWLILSAVILLLIGTLVWGMLGTLTTTQEVVAVVENNTATCYVPTEQINRIQQGMKVQLGDVNGTVSSLSTTPVQIDESFDAYALHLGKLSVGDWVCPVQVEIDAPDGAQLAQIVIEELAPISFVLN